MKVLQIKYCYTEDEANEFLKTLYVDNWEKGELAYPRLFNIQYCAKVQGDGVETAEADENGVTATAQVNSDIIAIVQYFIEK